MSDQLPPGQRTSRPTGQTGEANDAAQAIERLGKRDYPRSYTEIFVCDTDERVDAYRLPDKGFDAAARKLANRRDVQIVFHTAQFPRLDAHRRMFKIFRIGDTLFRDRGFRVVGTSMLLSGVVEVESTAISDRPGRRCRGTATRSRWCP